MVPSAISLTFTSTAFPLVAQMHIMRIRWAINRDVSSQRRRHLKPRRVTGGARLRIVSDSRHNSDVLKDGSLLLALEPIATLRFLNPLEGRSIKTSVQGRNEKKLSMDETTDIEEDRQRLREGGEIALAEAFSRYRRKLERIIEFRLDPSLRARVDPADILQEAYLQIARRLAEFVEGVPVSLFVWMRQKTIQTMIDVQRMHFRDKRDAHRERALAVPDHGQTSSISIARYLIDDVTSPSLAAVRSEEFATLQSALEGMNEVDREVLAMRHFEQLNNSEVAQSLGLSPTAASNRYIRAMTKLAEIMQSLPKK